mgnify:CR=1 FL=1
MKNNTRHTVVSKNFFFFCSEFANRVPARTVASTVSDFAPLTGAGDLSGLSGAGLSGFNPLAPGNPTTAAAAAVTAAALAGCTPLLNPLLKLEREWPAFIKPIPDRISAEDRVYLLQKGVFVMPHVRLQNALLRAFVEYVYPYMPLLELHEFLKAINDRTGASGKVSLFLYHAVMFSATAFVDETLLKEAGYASRREARRVFFSRTRVSLLGR